MQANQLRPSLAINGWTTLMMSMTALRVLMEPMFRSSVSYVQVCMYKVCVCVVFLYDLVSQTQISKLDACLG